MHNIPDLDEMTRMAGERVRQLLLEDREEQLAPVFQLWRGMHCTLALAPDLQDAQARIPMLDALRRLAADFRADRVCLLTEARLGPEAWLRPEGEPEGAVECVLAVATDGERTVARCWRVIRNPAGGVEALQEKPMREDSHCGAVDGILPARRIQSRPRR